eukprot:TRINITY_DN50503_c0_g1_i2.p1 TRINITY_DN50503_c0_g1~~TRINITY_DN50503_c0_g1_i2.p1  ORF type:complete len:338 (-),score=31.60 TRINITY_DN50503_c0_g1_i2:108-1121(-)
MGFDTGHAEPELQTATQMAPYEFTKRIRMPNDRPVLEMQNLPGSTTGIVALIATVGHVNYGNIFTLANPTTAASFSDFKQSVYTDVPPRFDITAPFRTLGKTPKGAILAYGFAYPNPTHRWWAWSTDALTFHIADIASLLPAPCQFGSPYKMRLISNSKAVLLHSFYKSLCVVENGASATPKVTGYPALRFAYIVVTNDVFVAWSNQQGVATSFDGVKWTPQNSYNDVTARQYCRFHNYPQHEIPRPETTQGSGGPPPLGASNGRLFFGGGPEGGNNLCSAPVNANGTVGAWERLPVLSRACGVWASHVASFPAIHTWVFGRYQDDRRDMVSFYSTA